jgi:hypothetical protein
LREYEKSGGAIKLVQNSGADSVIFLELFEKDNEKYIVARLIETKNAVVIDVIAIPYDKNNEAIKIPEIIARSFAEKIKKIATGGPMLTTVSILNFRAITSKPELIEFEKSLKKMVSIRLMSNKDILVCERENISEIVLENYLNNSDADFATADYLVDGVFELTDNKELAMTVFVSKKNAPQSKLLFTGAIEKIDDMAREIAEKISQKTGVHEETGIKWGKAEEGKQYLEEALWAYNCGLYQLSAQAVESAWALNCDDPKVNPLRIAAYANAAYPCSKIGQGVTDTFYDKAVVNVMKSSQYLDSAILASELMKRQMTTLKEEIKKDTGESLFGRKTWLDIANDTLLSGSRVLCAYHDYGCMNKDVEKTAYLRQNIRDIFEWCTENLQAFRWGFGHMRFWMIAAAYTPFWTENCDETKKAYKKLLIDSVTLGQIFYGTVIDEFCWRRDGATPYFVDWSGHLSQKDLDNIFIGFVDELAASDNIQLKATSLFLKIKNKPRDAHTPHFFSDQEKQNIALLNEFARANADKIVRGNLSIEDSLYRYYLDGETYLKILNAMLEYLTARPGADIKLNSIICGWESVNKIPHDDLRILNEKIRAYKEKIGRETSVVAIRELEKLIFGEIPELKDGGGDS